MHPTTFLSTQDPAGPILRSTHQDLEAADRALFTELEECLRREDFRGAIIQLLPLFAVVESKSEVIRCYELLFQLLPHFDSLDLLQNNLPHLLSRSSLMPEYQEKLALELALLYLSRNAYVDAMHCFAKALQINRCKTNYRSASNLFVTLLHLRLDGFLINSTPSVETIRLSLEEIETFKRFCLRKEDSSPFYQKMLSRIVQIPFERQEAYGPSHQKILEEQAKPFQEPELFVIERYWDAFQEMRSHFTSFTGDVRTFQKNTLEKFREFFNLLLEDAFALIGPAPCAYDIRAMGSVGREELCPYSDLEFMILIEDVLQKEYFKKLVTLLEIQIASLGETQHLPFLFTCLKMPNPSGLHIDNSPNQEERLIQIPEAMAKMQMRPGVCPQEIEHTTLKSMSLAQSNPKLYEEYRNELKVALLHQERAFTFFKHRLRDFKEHWKSPFNSSSGLMHIKTHFVEVLNHLLSDMALFCGIEKTNILDIIEALVKKGIFNEASGQLLQECVAKIYAIRVRLHVYYQRQKEEGSCSPSLEYAQLHTAEIQALEKCYWLVLVPLYSCMEKVITPDAFKQVFHQIDLIEIAFNNQSPAIIKQIARHLSQVETHVSYFSSLSRGSNEELRHIYLKEINDSAIREPLLQIPNAAGVRLAFAENLKTLEDTVLSLTDPDGQGVSIRLSSEESRYLKLEIVQEIMEGDNLYSQYKSAHRVCRLQRGDVDLHFKQKPSHPLMEYAIHNLTSRLAGYCTPPTVLVRFDLLNKSYPVLISQTIPGVALDASQPLDSKQWTWILLAAILTRPGDGRPSNYTVHNQKIYCIDNDISFVEPVISAWNGRTVQFCSALFCLKPLDTPLDPEVLQEFVSLDGAAILDGWIEDVIVKEQEYTALFSESERKRLFEEDPNNACTLTILFREGTLANLNLQLWRLQTCIQKSFQEGSRLTVGDLLKELISLREDSIGVYAYKAYAKAMSAPFPQRLAKATSRTQEASLTSVQYHQACLGKIPTLQEIEQAKLYSPAIAREEFFFTLLQRCSTHAGIRIDKTGSSIEANFEQLVDKTRQTLVLKALASQAEATKPHTVILQHAIHLTNALLTPFIHPALKTLDLRYCSQIDNDAVDLIAQCPFLEKLYLSGTAIAALRGGVFSRTLEFLALKELQLDRSPNLHTIQLRAPKLLTCTTKHNPLLETLQFKTWNGTVDCTDSPNAQVTHIQMECVNTLKGHTSWVTALVQLADGTLASGSSDNTIKLWDPISGALKQTLTGHTASVETLVQLADGTLASGSDDNTIKLWDPISGALKQTLTGHKGSERALVQLADNTLASGSLDKTIKLWDPVSGALKQTLKGHRDSVIALVQLADGTLASGSLDKTIKLWDPVSGALKQTLTGHTHEVRALVQLADGTLASGSWGNTIKLWDLASGALKHTLKEHIDWVRALVQLADGTLAIGSRDNTIKLWDPVSGALKQTLTGHTSWVIALVQLADGTLASISFDNTIKLWQ